MTMNQPGSDTMMRTDGDDLAASFRKLSCRRWRLTMIARHGGWLPPWLGSAWRGLLGHALKDLACNCDLPSRTPDKHEAGCSYARIFEPSIHVHNALLHSGQQAPAPYILRGEAGRTLKAGESLSVELALIGNSVTLAGLVIRALFMGAAHGLGNSKTQLVARSLDEIGLDGRLKRLTLAQLDATKEPPAPILATMPAWPGKVRLNFIQPVRIRIQGQYLGPEDFGFGVFFTQLLRRATLLKALYHEPDGADPNHAHWVRTARQLSFSNTDFHPLERARYSSRQQQKIPMGGVIGSCWLDGEAFEPFWPLIWLGQWIGVAKGASMGLGHYVCKLPSPAAEA